MGTNFIIFLLLLVTTYFLTYNIFSNNIKNSNTEMIQETTNQISYNYENYVSNILSTAETIQNTMQNDESLNYIDTNKFLNILLLMKPEILKIGVYDFSGDVLVETNSQETTNVKNESWFIDALNDTTIHFFSPINSNDDNYLVHFSKSIPVTKKNKKAILRLDIDFTDIIELGYKTDLGHNGHTIIID